MRKTALIVDDSKSARVVLKRLLESHNLDVDTAESAEAALEYLIDHRPDVVFMDHLMPGMDGFQAVTAIKNNPDTATIPIMMYTSQQGEVYVGQARALGAVGVLPKQVEPVEVSKVLRSLRVIGDEDERRKAAGAAGATDRVDEYPGLEKFDQGLRSLIQDLFDQQRAVLRRDLLDSYEAIAARVADEIRQPAPDVDDEVVPETIDDPAVPDRLKVAAVILSVLVVIFASLYWLREQSWQELQRQNSELRQALRQGQTMYAEDASQTRQQLGNYERSLDRAYSVALSSIEWGANQAAPYGFDRIPLGDERLALLEETSARLAQIGFSGLVRIETHVGDFCMVATGPASYALAPPDMEASLCDAIGFGDDKSVQLGQRQSLGFANFLTTAGARSSGKIQYEVVSLGNSEPAFAYPSSSVGISAGRWNEIAAANNRVEISLYPDDSQDKTAGL